MKKIYEDQEQTKKQFSEILRDRKLKFQKDQKFLNKILTSRLKSQDQTIINPERFTQIKKDMKIERFHQVLKPSSNIEQSNTSEIYQSQKQSQLYNIRREYLLQQKAQNFIQRIRKQKEQNQGKFLLLRKKEESRKQQERIKMQTIRRQYNQSISRKKMERMISNIMLHEQRMHLRDEQNLARELRKSNARSKTENKERSNGIRQSFQLQRQQSLQKHFQKVTPNLSSIIA